MKQFLLFKKNLKFEKRKWKIFNLELWFYTRLRCLTCQCSLLIFKGEYQRTKRLEKRDIETRNRHEFWGIQVVLTSDCRENMKIGPPGRITNLYVFLFWNDSAVSMLDERIYKLKGFGSSPTRKVNVMLDWERNKILQHHKTHNSRK